MGNASVFSIENPQTKKLRRNAKKLGEIISSMPLMRERVEEIGESRIRVFQPYHSTERSAYVQTNGRLYSLNGQRSNQALRKAIHQHLDDDTLEYASNIDEGVLVGMILTDHIGNIQDNRKQFGRSIMDAFEGYISLESEPRLNTAFAQTTILKPLQASASAVFVQDGYRLMRTAKNEKAKAYVQQLLDWSE